MLPQNGDATAQTLNYALGNLGGRQKSWMQGTPQALPGTAAVPRAVHEQPVTARRRGRPRKNVVEERNRPPLPTADAPERQPPSNSTSPQLANVVTGMHSLPTPPLAVLPSPTPSEETVQHAFLPRTSLAQPAPASPLETVFMDEAQNSRPQKRPAEPTEGITRPRRPAVSAEQPQPQPVQFQHPIPQVNPQPLVDMRGGHNVNYGQAVMQSHNHTLPRSEQFHAVADRTSQPQSWRPPLLTPPAPPVQPAAKPPIWYTPEECLRTMTVFTSTTVLHTHERIRMNVLKDATERLDWHYLLMHQIYCLLDFNPVVLPADFRQDPAVASARTVMQAVLAPNDGLSPAVLSFFSEYPYPFPQLAITWPRPFQAYVRSFWEFARRSANYGNLKHFCEQRGFPPLVVELALDLGVASPTFQKLLFTAVLRVAVWHGMPTNSFITTFENRALLLFHDDQASFLSRTPEQQHQFKDRDLQFWGSLYQQLMSECAGLALTHQIYPTPTQSQPPARPSSVVPSNAPTMAPDVQPSRPYSSTQSNIPPSVPHLSTRGRPPVQIQSAQQPLTQTAQQAHRGQEPTRARLLPTAGPAPPLQRIPAPERFGLHQANLQSPILRARERQTRLCHYFRDFLKEPTRLTSAGHQVEVWKTNIEDPSLLDSRPLAIVRNERRAPEAYRAVAGSRTMRLRCVKWPHPKPLPNEHVWAITETSWIPYSYFTMNNKSLDQRKKQHHGKDLPIDITSLLHQGENLLEMTVMTSINDVSYRNYLVAIEILEIMPQASIVQQCIAGRRLRADDVLDEIKRKLSATVDDEDMSVVESSLTIQLFDPFSTSKFCDIPVRSKACLHYDCFDLKTFLDTREQKGDATKTDQWRCPICRADARPQHLMVDGFIEQVQEKLTARGLARTRAIVVEKDGSWRPRVEVRDPNGVRDDSATPEPRTFTLPANAEVIDLSD